ncbi:MAG: NACHT domain-containing protein [Chitinophagales bacterium]
MKLLYLYTLSIFAMFLFYGIARLFFDSRKSYRQSRNYIFGKALTAILVFYTIRFGIGDQLLQLAIQTLRNMGWTSLAVPPPSEGWTNILADATFLLAVLGIVGFYAWSDLRRFNLMEGRAENYEKEVVKIQFPKEPEPINPVFHERIKDLFEMKYQSDNLQLQYDSKTNMLYGTYQSGFHHFLKVIYCHESVKGEHIETYVVEYMYNQIKLQIQNMASTEDILLEAYYVLDKGFFEEYDVKKIRTLTEDDLLNQLIDFKPYLKKLIYAYENDRLFSIRQKESEKPTLAQTFVPPTYLLGKDKENSHENMDEYIDNWLTQDSQKHLVLLGDYGMGKTSFMKHYAAKLAVDILKDGKMRRFPVLISLTNTSLRHGGIDKSIGDFLSKNIGVKVEVFNELVRRGKVVFLLDGFDEMGYLGTLDQRIKQLNEIWQLPQKNNKVVISGRPSYFFKEEELKEAFNVKEDETYNAPTENPYFERLTLQPLEIEAIEASIQKYYDIETAKKYMAFIQSNRSILDLCRRPQLMHLVRDMLPELLKNHEQKKLSASELMKLYLNRWIERQISKDIVSVIEQKTTKEKFVLDFFTDLAALYYEKEVEQLPAETILELLKEKMQVLQLERIEEIEGLQNEMLNGFLIERRSDEFKFVHKSFKEYLVAQKILQLIEEKDFKHPLIVEKDWTLEIIDFVYYKMEGKEVKGRIPLLLQLTKIVEVRLLLKPYQRWAEIKLSLKNYIFRFAAMMFFSENILNHLTGFKNMFFIQGEKRFGFKIQPFFILFIFYPICFGAFFGEFFGVIIITFRYTQVPIFDILTLFVFSISFLLSSSLYRLLGLGSINGFINGFLFGVISGIAMGRIFHFPIMLQIVQSLFFGIGFAIISAYGLERKIRFSSDYKPNNFLLTKNLNFLAKAWHIAILKGQFKKEDYPEIVYYLEHHFGKKL